MNLQTHLIPSSSPEWDAWLDFVHHDFFHTSACHQLARQFGEGEPWLYICGTPAKFFAWPYLLRRVEADLFDVSSVYGYPGPLLHNCDPSDQFIARSWKGLLDTWVSQGVVSAFSRFHPLLANHRVLAHILPEMQPMGIENRLSYRGKTVAIDLDHPFPMVWKNYRRSVRTHIDRALDAGVSVAFDAAWKNTSDFLRVYHCSMDRNHASEHYYLTAETLSRLRSALGNAGFLAVARYEGICIAAVLLIQHRGIVTAYLAGTDPAYLSLSPMSLLFHEVRNRSRQNGWSQFHIGGGRGGRETDTLFRFKASFSPCHYPFYTGQWILRSAVYASLVKRHRDRAASVCLGLDEEFFPLYRAPICETSIQELVRPVVVQ